MSVLDKIPPRHDRPRSRIHSLDLARGVAILGTLATNIWLFTHPQGMVGHFLTPVTAQTPAAWAGVQQLLAALTNGKFLGLLALMFGIGLEIQRRSFARSGTRWPGPYLWRAALLLLDGFLNFVLLVEFDVLMGYAITGAVVAFLMLTSDRAQRLWIWVAGVIHVLAVAILAGLVTLSGGTGSAPPVSAPGLVSDPDSSFFDLALFRLEHFAVLRLETPVLIFGMSVALFLIGAHLFRAGLFAPDGAVLRRRLMLLGLVVIAPLDLALGTFGGLAGFVLDRYVLAPVVALGLLALIADIGLRTSPTAWPSLRCQELGRVALSGYILQNLIASVVFYPWGLGLAAHLGAWRVPATVAAFLVISSLVIVFAHLWLRRFNLGPVEWMWKKSYLALSRARRG